MRIPGFTAEASLCKTSARYQADGQAINSPIYTIIPAIPNCKNCDDILDMCETTGWRPRALCSACAVGNCFNEPPEPDPFPHPFPNPFLLSRF